MWPVHQLKKKNTKNFSAKKNCDGKNNTPEATQSTS